MHLTLFHTVDDDQLVVCFGYDNAIQRRERLVTDVE